MGLATSGMVWEAVVKQYRVAKLEEFELYVVQVLNSYWFGLVKRWENFSYGEYTNRSFACDTAARWNEMEREEEARRASKWVPIDCERGNNKAALPKEEK